MAVKYSFMTFSTPGLSLDENLSAARRFGYDGIEPRLECGHRHGIEVEATVAERMEIRRRAEDSGIALCCLATSCRYAHPENRDEMIDITRRCIDLASDVGAPRLRVFGGQFPESVSREEAVELVVSALVSLASQAKARGVTLCLETHDSWCDPKHVAEIMRRVNHPNVGVNWDIMHPIRMRFANASESFEILEPWIRHAHVHDGTLEDPLRMMPMGEGGIDHKTAVRLLRDHPGEVYLSGEWIDYLPPEEHLPQEVQVLKSYAASTS